MVGTREPTAEQLEVGRAALGEILRAEAAPSARLILRPMATEARPRSRLDPEVFRLPVERIREGYYTDAYFNLTQGAARGARAAGRA